MRNNQLLAQHDRCDIESQIKLEIEFVDVIPAVLADNHVLFEFSVEVNERNLQVERDCA